MFGKKKDNKPDSPPASTSRSDQTDAPPGYDSSSRALPPYRASTGANAKKDSMVSELPSEFRIGKKTVSSLITLTDIQAHILLLGSFARLRAEVASFPSDPDLDLVHPSLDGEGKLSIFVRRAVDRFERFWKGLEEATKDKGQRERFTEDAILPPLDVLMVWHTYLLNPRIYYIDLSLRPSLIDLSFFPLHAVASQIDPMTFEYNQTPLQAANFTFLAGGVSPSLSLSTTFRDTLMVSCPCCSTHVEASWLSLPVESPNSTISPSGEALLQPKIGTGYVQEGFRTTCPGCGLEFGKGQLALRKFANELARVKEHDVLFPGILLVPETGLPITDASSYALCSSLVKIFSPFFPLPSNPAVILSDSSEVDPASMKLFYSRDMTFIHEAFEVALQMGKVAKIPRLVRRMGRIWSRYSFHEEGFGIELVGAVLRQGSFIEKLGELGWLKPRRFESSDFLITRTVGRYHAFVDLISFQPMKALCPTLDIDLGWHTHQLQGSKYRSDMVSLVERFIDHDDTIEETALEGAWRSTSGAWLDRFKVPYSTCGCAPEAAQQSPLGGLFGKKKKASGPLDDDALELAQNDPSHPSVHPSIVVVGHKTAEGKRERREQMRDKIDTKLEQKWLQKNPGIEPSARKTHARTEFFHTPLYSIYWGVSKTGNYPGSIQAWGLGSECACHNMDGRKVARGKCAANLGIGGGAKCASGGAGACSSTTCIGSGACSSRGIGGFAGCGTMSAKGMMPMNGNMAGGMSQGMSGFGGGGGM